MAERIDERRERTVKTVATFTAMMHSYEKGELAAAAEAQSILEQLGVTVRFGQRRQRKGVSDGR